MPSCGASVQSQKIVEPIECRSVVMAHDNSGAIPTMLRKRFNTNAQSPIALRSLLGAVMLVAMAQLIPLLAILFLLAMSP